MSRALLILVAILLGVWLALAAERITTAAAHRHDFELDGVRP